MANKTYNKHAVLAYLFDMKTNVARSILGKILISPYGKSVRGFVPPAALRPLRGQILCLT